MLQVETSGADRLEPGVRHGLAAEEAEVLEAGSSGGDRGEPGIRHIHAGVEVGAGGWGNRPRPPRARVSLACHSGWIMPWR